MKKVKIALLIVIAAVSVLPACRKGAEDPIISLRSRNTRLMQTWVLSDISGTYFNDAVTYTNSSVLVGTSIFFTNVSYKMTFAKDGIFSYIETKTISGNNSSETTTNKSYWTWLNLNKNRDGLECQTDLDNLVNSSNSYNKFYIDCLKESTLTLIYDNETSTDITSLKFTFTKQ